MSEEMEDGTFQAFETEPSTSGADGGGGTEADGASPYEEDAAEALGLDEARDDLLAAIEELGLGSRDPTNADAPAAGCYLSIVPVDRHGHGGVVVGWLLGDSAGRGETVRSTAVESVDILNEALGPLLLGLGFPIEPYAADGRWIVTGSRAASSSGQTVGSPAAGIED